MRAWRVDFRVDLDGSAPHQLAFQELPAVYAGSTYRRLITYSGKVPWTRRQLVETDRNGKLAGRVAPLANWTTKAGNPVTRPALESVAGVDRRAALPKFHGKTFAMRAKAASPAVNDKAPGFGRKVVLYATCFANYNNPKIGDATRAVLAHNGVATEVVNASAFNAVFWIVLHE